MGNSKQTQRHLIRNHQMNKFTKSLFSTALLASLTEAKGIFNSCLKLSDATAGNDGMRLHGVKTCHTDGNVTGLQFFMAEDPYQSVGEVPYDMKPIGPMTGECDYLELKEGLDEIKATLRNNESGLSMMYQIKDSPNEMKVEYGNVKLVRRTKWEFNDSNPLVGLYGRQTATGITQLGFITLDTACQAAHEDVIVDPSDPSSPAGQTEDPTANTNTQQPLPSQPD